MVSPIKPYIDRLESLTNVLEDHENKRQKVLDFMRSAPCLCFMKEGTTGKYQFANAALCSVMDLEESAILGKTDFDLFSVEDAREFAKFDSKVLNEKHSFVIIQSIKHKVYLIAKFLVVNGGESVGGFAFEIPSSFKLVNEERGVENKNATGSGRTPN